VAIYVVFILAENSLPAMDGHDCPHFNELRVGMVSPRIFVRW
jgi:hypothetical protein